MAHKPSERTNRVKPDDTLNLTPLIDMVTCLMFFLMMFASMLPVVIIDAPLPKIASTADEVRKAKESENKLEIMLYINANGLSVKSDVGSQSFGLTTKGKYDYEGLHKFLVSLHSKRPTTREITLMPADDTPYEVMIEVMSGGGGGGGFSANTTHRSKYTKRAKSRQYTSGALMLTSMLDILMAILFFLMKNYNELQSDFTIGKDISLPFSSAAVPPMPSLQLVVTQKAILLDDKPIAEIINGDVDRKMLFRDGVTIVPLAQELKKQKDRSQFIQKHSDTHSFTGGIVMQADKGLQFNVLKKVIYTAGISDFVMFKLAVLKKDEI